jgi:hypothetical protein
MLPASVKRSTTPTYTTTSCTRLIYHDIMIYHELSMNYPWIIHDYPWIEAEVSSSLILSVSCQKVSESQSRTL